MWSFFKKAKPAQERKEPKVVVRPHSRNAWAAANVDRLVSGWVTQSVPINQQTEQELRTLRARSRQLAKDEPYFRRFFQLCRSNIVGPRGIVLRSEVMRSNGKPDEVAQSAIEKAWKEFNQRGFGCAVDRYSGIEMQNLMVDQIFRDGELILLQYNGAEENTHGISFRFIDPELMDVNHKETRGRNKVRMGIETNTRGKVVAYHFHSTDTTHNSYYQVGGKGYLRVDAKYVIHRFITEYVDQLRGFPHGVAAMMRLKMLNGYEEAELISARIGASSMGFIQRGENGEGFEGDDEEAEEAHIEADPGSFHYLDYGATVQDWSPNHTPTAYKDYVKGVLRGISSGLGVNYNTLANDLEGVNYSSIRAGVLEDRELWKALQTWFIQQVMDDIFERWLQSALLMGAIVLPRGLALKSSNITRYREHSFQGRRWAWVDPQKDINAAKEAIALGVRSRSSIIREQGENPDEVWREIAREKQTLDELGILSVPASESEEPSKPEQEGEEDAN